MNAQQVIDEMESRFRSEDGQPIYAVHITREEWEVVMQAFDFARVAKEAYDDMTKKPSAEHMASLLDYLPARRGEDV